MTWEAAEVVQTATFRPESINEVQVLFMLFSFQRHEANAKKIKR
jgi:hypothetical protein